MAKKIYISGEIGFDATPAAFRSSLAEAKGGDIDIHIASPGGYVYEGIEIFNALRDYRRDHARAKIQITLKGLAASMASYIAATPAADKVVAEDNAVFMIHKAWTGCVGNSADLEKTAATLKGLDQLMASAYAKRTGKSIDDILALMDAETWYFGEEIKAAGFVDEIIDAEDGNRDKSAALAAAKTAFSAVAARMRGSERAKTDLAQVAAMITTSSASSTPAPAGSAPAPQAPAARTGGTLDLNEIERTPGPETFVEGNVGRNNGQMASGSVPGTPAPQIPRTAAELRAQAPGIYAELVTEARGIIEAERKRQEETERVPKLLGLKKQLKGSPLFEGISEIVEEGVTDGKSLHDTLLAVVKWTASGSAVASLEGVPDIRIGQTEGASGEGPTKPAGFKRTTMEA
ncbi:MAG TPA: Clp protease ClpP [Spirochaetota bacterium]|nr:Clp protease ClpP [Spirochaetota bacterium]HRZ26616.1 Clp protease ClpP [Spirochaetota bacterium]